MDSPRKPPESWTERLGISPCPPLTYPSYTYADVVAEFCDAISREFGVELDVKKLECQLTNGEPTDKMVLGVYETIKEYALEWLLHRLYIANPALAIGAQHNYHKNIIGLISHELWDMKSKLLYAYIDDDMDLGKKTKLLIGSHETIENVISKVEICIQEAKDTLLNSSVAQDNLLTPQSSPLLHPPSPRY